MGITEGEGSAAAGEGHGAHAQGHEADLLRLHLLGISRLGRGRHAQRCWGVARQQTAHLRKRATVLFIDILCNFRTCIHKM